MDKISAIQWLEARGFNRVGAARDHRRKRETVTFYLKTRVAGCYAAGDSRYPFISGYGGTPADALADLAKQIRRTADVDATWIASLPDELA